MCTNEGEMHMVIESVEKAPLYGASEQIIIPQIMYSFQNKEDIRGISYTINGIKYQFSNDEGHKVYSSGSYSAPRPMTKKEFKDICKIMVMNSSSYGETEELILSEIEKSQKDKIKAPSPGCRAESLEILP